MWLVTGWYPTCASSAQQTAPGCARAHSCNQYHAESPAHMLQVMLCSNSHVLPSPQPHHQNILYGVLSAPPRVESEASFPPLCCHAALGYMACEAPSSTPHKTHKLQGALLTTQLPCCTCPAIAANVVHHTAALRRQGSPVGQLGTFGRCQPPLALHARVTQPS